MQDTPRVCFVAIAVFKSLALSRSLSDVCARHIFPAFCHLTFPLCHVTRGGGVAGSDVRVARQVRSLCREDCLLLETSYCGAEYAAARHQPGLSHCTPVKYQQMSGVL